MKTKKEQIEEMAQIITHAISVECELNNADIGTCRDCPLLLNDENCQSHLVAISLFNAGYQKLPEDTILLDNDCYTMLALKKPLEDIVLKAVKEFAEKLKQRITDDNGTPIATLTAKGIDELLKEYEE